MPPEEGEGTVGSGESTTNGTANTNTGTANTNAGDGAQGGEGGENEQFDQERAMATIRAQRETERSLRQQLAEHQKTLKELQDKNKTDEQLAKEELERLRGVEAEYNRVKREAVTRNAFIGEATKANATKPDLLFKLAADQLELDDEGHPRNTTAVINALKKDNPELFAVGSADGGSGRGTAPKGSGMMERIRQARGMG